MAKVDRDLEEIVEFCKKFKKNLEAIDSEASNLHSLGKEIESSLSGSQFATKASASVGQTAKKIHDAVVGGIPDIEKMQKRTEEQIATRNKLESSL